MTTTDFRCPLERFLVVRPSIVARQRCDVRFAQVRLLASCDQLASVLQSLQFLGIALQPHRAFCKRPNWINGSWDWGDEGRIRYPLCFQQAKFCAILSNAGQFLLETGR